MINKPTLNEKSYYHQQLIKKFGGKEAQKMLDRTHWAIHFFDDRTVKAIRRYVPAGKMKKARYIPS